MPCNLQGASIELYFIAYYDFGLSARKVFLFRKFSFKNKPQIRVKPKTDPDPQPWLPSPSFQYQKCENMFYQI